jgi:radical SAM superfamily enzyme YgiQ (UPF0313 family)
LKKVLLVSSNRCKYPYPVYPLGVSHIASALMNQGYSVRLCDMGIENDQLESTLSEFQPDFIGFSIRNIDDIRIDNTTYFIPELNDLVKLVRSCCRVPIILGGSAFSLFPAQLLKLTYADYGIIGEGEETIVNLLALLSQNNQPTEIQLSSLHGLVYHLGDSVKCNAVRVMDPKAISFAFRDTAIEPYYRENSGVINIQTQRGCPCKCCYCTYPLIEGSSPRYRSAEQVVSELIESKKRGNNYFFFVDSVFNTNTNHVISICEELIRREINIAWSCFLKPSNLSEEMMVLMARAGLKHIEFGSDSFCDSVLHEYNKDFTFEEIYNASEWARIQNIHYAHFLITGGPGETEKTLHESFENSKRLSKTVIFPFTGMRLFPGTSLFNRAIREKLIESSANCLEPLFYISPMISKDKITQILQSFQKMMPNWVIEDASPALMNIMSRLRKKGISGPLWEFLAR